MKDNQFVKIILYVLIVVFIFLLLRNNRSLEGYDLSDLTVGKWKLSGDSSTFNVSSSEDGKTVSFGAPVKVQDLTIMKATQDSGLMRKDEPALIIPGNGLFIGTADGRGIRIDKDGNLQVRNDILTYGENIWINRDGSYFRLIGSNDGNVYIDGGGWTVFRNRGDQYKSQFSPQGHLYMENLKNNSCCSKGR